MGQELAEETFLHNKLGPNNKILHKNKQLTRQRKTKFDKSIKHFVLLKWTWLNVLELKGAPLK